LAYPCKLVLSARFTQRTEALELRLDSGDIDHGLRHLGVAVDDLWRLDHSDPSAYAALCGPVDRSWELWRAATDGTRDVVASGLTRDDALCRQSEAETSADDDERADRFVAMRTS
jgi:hypothetical protein